ncbi:MAG: NAD(P)-dependent oxidoreductase [Acidobacteriia bacterium]|nr:NAD(P)-dependent oxidoreductase [Terriglobia bacterium]
MIREFSPDLMLHMAARTDLDGKTVDDYRANTEGVSNIINALVGLRSLRRAIFASSMLVCRLGYRPHGDSDYNPTTAYGESKVEGERLVRGVRDGSLPWTIVRPTSLWGPWFDIPYRDFFDAVRAGWYMHPRGVSVQRSYGFVLNSVIQLERLSETSEDDVLGRTFYLADYNPIELRAWAELIRSAFGAPQIREVPLWFLGAAAKIGDILRAVGLRQVPLTTFRLRNLTTEAIMDLAPLEAACGRTPYDVEQGVKITTEWMQHLVGRNLRQHP